jgi:4-diphosphocytidyl-2C-methyl-D-erythritol kinase
MLSLDPLPPRDVTLVCFPFGVSTRDAYVWLDESRGDAAPTPNVIAKHDLSSWERIANAAHNDFSDVVVPKFHEIATAVGSLRSSATGSRADAIVLLAGSGATVFMVADEPDGTATSRLTMSGVQHRAVLTRTATRVVDVEVSD